jgi:hypothetical protein
MRKIFIFILITSCSFQTAYALNDTLKNKYPHSVLTDDFGILNEKDLRIENPRPFSLGRKLGETIYWQCFPRESLSVTLEDFGYTSADIGGEENYSGLVIKVENHEYDMRRRWPLSTYRKKLDAWIKLMQNEKYVCVAGRFFGCKNKITFDGIQYKHCSWVFEKLKTKKGCDSYFQNDCHA